LKIMGSQWPAWRSGLARDVATLTQESLPQLSTRFETETNEMVERNIFRFTKTLLLRKRDELKLQEAISPHVVLTIADALFKGEPVQDAYLPLTRSLQALISESLDGKSPAHAANDDPGGIYALLV